MVPAAAPPVAVTGVLARSSHPAPEYRLGVRLDTPLNQLDPPHRLSAARLAAFGRLDINTVTDLIKHLPARYERIEAESSIIELKEGQIGRATGEITATRFSGGKGGRFSKSGRFEAVLLDHTGRLDLVWFNQPHMVHRILPGMRLRAQGKVARYGVGLQIVNPVIEPVRGTEPEHPVEPVTEGQTGATLRPVYPAVDGLPSATIQKFIAGILPLVVDQIEDHLPAEYRQARSLPLLSEAYRMAHAPSDEGQHVEARRRLAFDELLLLQLGVFLRREQVLRGTSAPVLGWNQTIDQRIRARFGFALTPDQDSVVIEIAADLQTPAPANRLLQGDVGSGKTVVALYAMLMAVAAGRQAALMAPTEILAEQHFRSISDALQGSKVRVALLTGSMSDRERAERFSGLACGDIDIAIGTHALIGQSVRFASLAVAVIDEQHRFGVHQRAGLRGKSGTDDRGRPMTPHTIVMTATPIPRTLALTLFGDLDVSTIRHLPPGRTPVITRWVQPAQSGEVYTWLRTRLDAGDQAFVVVPAIDAGASTAGEGGDAELNDLRTVHARLEAGELAGKRLAVLHGRLSAHTRDAVMSRFRSGQIDCLIATTVIEVGVDVPNATVMVIEHADQFGLAQLHQLRGRVGRGAKQSVCVLMGDASNPDAEARLRTMVATTDGFELAEKDLELRGPGEVFGARQAGAPSLLVADLMRDRDLLSLARRDAQAWIERSPSLGTPKESLLRKRLMQQHGRWLGLADVG